DRRASPHTHRDDRPGSVRRGSPARLTPAESGHRPVWRWQARWQRVWQSRRTLDQRRSGTTPQYTYPLDSVVNALLTAGSGAKRGARCNARYDLTNHLPGISGIRGTDIGLPAHRPEKARIGTSEC